MDGLVFVSGRTFFMASDSHTFRAQGSPRAGTTAFPTPSFAPD